MTYVGVKSYGQDDYWRAQVTIAKHKAIIYTSSSARECASAYNHYCAMMGTQRGGIDPEIGMIHDIMKLLTTMQAVGTIEVQGVATRWLKRIEELKQEATEA